MSKSGFASFAFRLWLAACMVVILGISFLGYVAAEKRIDRASKDKIDLILLAEELKASSDNLTRMARSFVVTMDPAYEDSYREILDIREGRLPGRGPKSRVYWELGERNPATGGGAANGAVSLVERMRRTGATEDEFRLLTEAKEESDRLAAVDPRAMEETRKLVLPALQDLATHSDPAVKYFSGTATYSVKFEISDLKSRMSLDLGKVHDLARVTLNGKDLGVLWQTPYRLDVSQALKTGANQLDIAVTNTWHNRLVGDEQFPADFEWGEDRGEKGHAMKAYPDWFVKNQARPEKNRKCFVSWYYHRKDTPLQPAGLVGPVMLVPESHAIIQP